MDNSMYIFPFNPLRIYSPKILFICCIQTFPTSKLLCWSLSQQHMANE